MKKYLVSAAALLALGLAACSENRDDFAITSDVRKELAEELVAGTIAVVTVARVVTLTGAVPDIDTKDKAQDVAENVSGVDRVVNNLRTTTAADAPMHPGAIPPHPGAIPPAANVPNPMEPGAPRQAPNVQ